MVDDDVIQYIRETKVNRMVREIIVHCSATKEYSDYNVSDIDRWHRNKGWDGCGYHFVINLRGEIQKGRDLTLVGAHCQGRNTGSIGVCYIGGLDAKGKPKDTRNKAQKDALVFLLAELKRKFPRITIHSHRDFTRKECPCFDATKEYMTLTV